MEADIPQDDIVTFKTCCTTLFCVNAIDGNCSHISTNLDDSAE